MLEISKPAPIMYSRSGVGQHAQGSRHLGQITAGHKRGRLITDTKLSLAAAITSLDIP
jgi:hypothetical protein